MAGSTPVQSGGKKPDLRAERFVGVNERDETNDYAFVDGIAFNRCDSIYVPNLAAGEAVDLSSHPRVLYSEIPLGPCAIVAFADRTDLANETNEADNYSILRDYSVGPNSLEEITIMLPGDVPLVMMRIPAGSFEMGTAGGSAGDPGWANDDEAPLHTVNIGYDFYMGKYEVTQRQWLALIGGWPGSGPSSEYGLGDNHPAYYRSWDDAQYFVSTLNIHVTYTGQGPAAFRLPSEAEWEYACRAGSTTRFHFGDSTLGPEECNSGPPGDLGDYAWFCGNNGASGTPQYGSKPVGTKLPNPFGLFDMHGNVYEWCQDWHYWSYDGAPTDGSAWEEPWGQYRVVRGSYWGNIPMTCRSAERYDIEPQHSGPHTGLRVVRGIE